MLIIDPISDLSSIGTPAGVKSMLVRLVDSLKEQEITAVLTCLNQGDRPTDVSSVDASSLMDTWIVLQDLESNGERTRGLFVPKSRGMEHSKQVREFLLTDQGVQLTDAYLGPKGMLTGTARAEQEAEDARERLLRVRERERLESALTRRRALGDAKIAAVHAESAAEQDEIGQALLTVQELENTLAAGRVEMGRLRQG